MATYIMSDIHGNFGRYKEFLQYSRFSGDDILYIVGDVLDRGSEAIPMIQDIMQRNNVIMIKGNHEQMLLPILDDLTYQSHEAQNQIISDEMEIAQIGQEDTLRDFCKLSSREQNKITYFISRLPVYKELAVNGINYILVHGGLPDFSDMPLEYYDENDLLFGPHDFFINHYGDGTKIIVGHIPTKFIEGAVPDEIYHINDTIAMDCGCGFGGQLGVLCLETMEEMYF